MPERHALVTGGSRGIGLAIATALARSGVEVAIVARDATVLEQAAAAIERATARRPTVWPCDLADPAARRALIDALSGAVPAVDILVNNAGTSHRGPFLELDDADWRGDLELKLLAGIDLARAVLPGMRDRRWGRIVNILSIAGKTPGPASGPTSVSRAAGLALTKALSAEFAGDGITVNAICIGSVLTDQWHRMHRRDAPQLDFAEFVAARAAQVPVGRLGRPEEVAALVGFLVSDDAGFVTGTAINFDGGRCAAL